jgi:hypothetical protein
MSYHLITHQAILFQYYAVGSVTYFANYKVLVEALLTVRVATDRCGAFEHEVKAEGAYQVFEAIHQLLSLCKWRGL